MKYINYFDFLPLVYLTNVLMSLNKVAWYSESKPVLVVTRDRRSPWIWQRSVSPNENGLHFHTVYSSPSVLHKTPTLWSPNCITVIRNRLLNNIHHAASYDKRHGWCYSHSTRVDELTTFYSFCWNLNILYKQATTNCHTQFPRQSHAQRGTLWIQLSKNMAWGCLQVQYVYKHFQLLERRWRYTTHTKS